MGVTYENGKYRARISVGGGKRRSLGRYDTKLKAQRAIARYRANDEATQEAELQKGLDNLSLENDQPLKSFYGIENMPVVEEKPSLWDRIKSVWQNIRQRN